LLLSFLVVGNTGGQVQPSISNYFRYGNGDQTLGDITNGLIYRENLTDVKFRFPYDVTVGLRLLFDNPPEVGRSFNGLSRRFVEYNKDNLELRAGNFSELYGKGLVVNLFENRGLAYDTWADGLKASYNTGGLKASLLYGAIEFADSINFWRVESYTLTGGNIEYKFNRNISAGVSYVDAVGNIPLPGIDYNLRAEIPEFYLTLDVENFKWFVNWSQKRTDVKNVQTSPGTGLYSSLSFNTSGLGIVIDYKNYRYDERDPFERYDYTRPTRMLPFMNPPIVQKEHSYILLSRSIHEIDFNDEVGLQLELFYSLFEDTYINFNSSLSSRHNFYLYDQSNFSFVKESRAGDFLPATGDKYSPFREYLLEIEQSLGFSTVVNFGFARRSKVLYNDFTGNAGSHKIRSTVIPLLVQHTFNEDYSTILQFEYESVFDNYNTSQTEYSNSFISLSGNFYSVFNLNLRYEITTNDYDLSGKDNWFTVETGYRLSSTNNITVSYGSERGGQTCSNGVCRYILPFEGFKMTFLSKI
jgi:hypothetical protein